MEKLEVSRRQLLVSAAATAVAGRAEAAPSAALMPATNLVWLDRKAPSYLCGTTLGVPWPRGVVEAGQSFQLTSSEGAVALQSWPLAYWPDGSVKWSAHAVAPNAARATDLTLKLGGAAAPADPVQVTTRADSFTITTGQHRWIVARKGNDILTGAFIGSQQILKAARLVAQAQDRPDLEAADKVQKFSYIGKIESAEVEQSGPVRVVIRLQGRHYGHGRNWLPFTLRFYFYAGAQSFRIVHSFIFDGDENKDFISGLGLTAEVPLRDALYDRHIRFTAQNKGVWAEAVQTVTGLRRDPGEAFRKAQIAGEALLPLAGMSPAVRDTMQWVPAWNDFTLTQHTSDGFTIRKRTASGQAWIASASGLRANGLAYVGGAKGGVALGVTDFWQRAPTGLDVRAAATDTASLTAWLWSPNAPAMDLRSYRGVAGMDSHEKENQGLAITYEDYEAGWGKPYGIARTSELTLWVLPATPSNPLLADMAEAIETPPRLTVLPERLQLAKVFGAWSVPDTSTPAKAAVENRLSYLNDYYLKQIGQRRWYGFWDYGDVMHTYDADRHVWRYDVGGYAWDNSELSSDMLFWYSFLRTGRADIFRMAEAMTRHTGEVDVYHLGAYKGFGTRHGVQHFSDSSKQPRISNAAYRRFYYYLTADERCGDLMHELIHSDETLRVVDISRKLGPAASQRLSEAGGNPICGFGTSWGSFVAAWLTEWERTGDTHWRDRILTGMNSIAGLKRGWFAGEAPYDLKTGTFLGAGDAVSVSHLSCMFGIFEIQAELFDLVEAPAYKKVWLDYCRYYNAPNAEMNAFLGEVPKNRGQRVAHSRLTAYAARDAQDAALAKRAWKEFFETEGTPGGKPRHLAGPDVLNPIDEDPAVSTNDTAQWGLAAIANIALLNPPRN